MKNLKDKLYLKYLNFDSIFDSISMAVSGNKITWENSIDSKTPVFIEIKEEYFEGSAETVGIELTIEQTKELIGFLQKSVDFLENNKKV